MQKKQVILLSLLVGFFFLMGLLVIKTVRPKVPQLYFEQGCPDSTGQGPVFNWNNVKKEERAYLKELRLKFKLDDLVADCPTELDKVLAVSNWVHGLISHDACNKPVKTDPLSILTEVIEQKKSFRCVEIASVLAGCLNALGIPARRVGLRTKDVETRESGAGHVVAEAYLESLDKWIMIDGQMNVVPVLNGRPLHAVELQEALTQQKSGLGVLSLKSAKTFPEYADWIGEYLYHFVVYLAPSCMSEGKSSNQRLMLVPKGAKNPTVFQRTTPEENVMYTYSAACFYQKP